MQQNNPLRQLYIENYAHLIRTARNFANGDLAEDLVQETFLIAQKRIIQVHITALHVFCVIKFVKTDDFKGRTVLTFLHMPV